MVSFSAVRPKSKRHRRITDSRICAITLVVLRTPSDPTPHRLRRSQPNPCPNSLGWNRTPAMRTRGALNMRLVGPSFAEKNHVNLFRHSFLRALRQKKKSGTLAG